ncbi:uncharacterized protein LOC134221137 [Armigeres subalbatus]|uniref:uncharacterized protein LOC134221137 n=1 Tax=Armigeres subalbatus TaxID=124917 RepID=UPI002ED4A16A
MDQLSQNAVENLSTGEEEYLDESQQEMDPLAAACGSELYHEFPYILDDVEVGDNLSISCDENDNVDAEHNKFFFHAEFIVKKYTRQKSGLCVNLKKNVPEKVSGNTLAEVLKCLWYFVEPHLCREVDVSEVDGIKVSWSKNEKPDIRDIAKFIYLRDTKRKNLIRIDQLGEGKIMLHWREKTMTVFAFAYSQSVSSLAIWEAVNKCLLQPADTDRAGAPSNVHLDVLVRELKEEHSHLESHDSGWIQWATAIHASPAHVQEDMKKKMPPVEMRGMFWSLPTTESTRIECTRQGLTVAQNIVDNLSTGVAELCDKADELMNLAFEVKLLAQGVKEKLNICQDMISGMQTSSAPQETVISQGLREKVGDMMDIDHI